MTVTEELPPPEDPPRLTRIWAELDNGQDLAAVLAEDSRPGARPWPWPWRNPDDG